MSKIISIMLLFVFLAGCKGKETMEYMFMPLEEDNEGQSAQIFNIADTFSPKENAKIYGQLRTLFGEPLYETPDWENMYSYLVSAQTVSGTDVILRIYNGPTGAAIGGDRTQPGIMEAAQALKRKIKSAKTTDYEYVGYYLDTDSKITYKIKNGYISVSETKISGEELERVEKLFYPD